MSQGKDSANSFGLADLPDAWHTCLIQDYLADTESKDSASKQDDPDNPNPHDNQVHRRALFSCSKTWCHLVLLHSPCSSITVTDKPGTTALWRNVGWRRATSALASAAQRVIWRLEVLPSSQPAALPASMDEASANDTEPGAVSCRLMASNDVKDNQQVVQGVGQVGGPRRRSVADEARDWIEMVTDIVFTAEQDYPVTLTTLKRLGLQYMAKLRTLTTHMDFAAGNDDDDEDSPDGACTSTATTAASSMPIPPGLQRLEVFTTDGMEWLPAVMLCGSQIKTFIFGDDSQDLSGTEDTLLQALPLMPHLEEVAIQFQLTDQIMAVLQGLSKLNKVHFGGLNLEQDYTDMQGFSWNDLYLTPAPYQFVRSTDPTDMFRLPVTAIREIGIEEGLHCYKDNREDAGEKLDALLALPSLTLIPGDSDPLYSGVGTPVEGQFTVVAGVTAARLHNIASKISDEYGTVELQVFRTDLENPLCVTPYVGLCNTPQHVVCLRLEAFFTDTTSASSATTKAQREALAHIVQQPHIAGIHCMVSGEDVEVAWYLQLLEDLKAMNLVEGSCKIEIRGHATGVAMWLSTRPHLAYLSPYVALYPEDGVKLMLSGIKDCKMKLDCTIDEGENVEEIRLVPDTEQDEDLLSRLALLHQQLPLAIAAQEVIQGQAGEVQVQVQAGNQEPGQGGDQVNNPNDNAVQGPNPHAEQAEGHEGHI